MAWGEVAHGIGPRCPLPASTRPVAWTKVAHGAEPSRPYPSSTTPMAWHAGLDGDEKADPYRSGNHDAGVEEARPRGCNRPRDPRHPLETAAFLRFLIFPSGKALRASR